MRFVVYLFLLNNGGLMRNVYKKEITRFAFVYMALFYIARFGIGCAPIPDNVPQATDVAQGFTGDRGPAGITGSTGLAGTNGLSCVVKQNDLGVLITCPDGSTALVLHKTRKKK